MGFYSIGDRHLARKRQMNLRIAGKSMTEMAVAVHVTYSIISAGFYKRIIWILGCGCYS